MRAAFFKTRDSLKALRMSIPSNEIHPLAVPASKMVLFPMTSHVTLKTWRSKPRRGRRWTQGRPGAADSTMDAGECQSRPEWRTDRHNQKATSAIKSMRSASPARGGRPKVCAMAGVAKK